MTYGSLWGNNLLNKVRLSSTGSLRSLWLALHKADPTSSGLATTEISGGSYERQPVKFATPSGKAMVNSIPVKWPSLRANTITHIAVWDAKVGGNIVAYGSITPQTIRNGQAKIIQIGKFAISI